MMGIVFDNLWREHASRNGTLRERKPDANVFAVALLFGQRFEQEGLPANLKFRLDILRAGWPPVLEIGSRPDDTHCDARNRCSRFVPLCVGRLTAKAHGAPFSYSTRSESSRRATSATGDQALQPPWSRPSTRAQAAGLPRRSSSI
jgi:hypothetical protein